MNRRRRSARRILVTVLLAALAVIAATRAAASQDIAKGESIARTSCAGCHSIEAGGSESGGGPPSLVSVARKPGTNRAALRIFLSTAHAKMANYALTQDEIADVSAYILSLRK